MTNPERQPLSSLFWYREFQQWADHPAASGFVPVHPDTLRAVAAILLEHASAQPVAHSKSEQKRLEAMTDKPVTLEALLDAHTVPVGHFFRSEINRFYCQHCGGPYEMHIHTDEASTCPT